MDDPYPELQETVTTGSESYGTGHAVHVHNSNAKLEGPNMGGLNVWV
jgi:hypothetical protein